MTWDHALADFLPTPDTVRMVREVLTNKWYPREWPALGHPQKPVSSPRPAVPANFASRPSTGPLSGTNDAALPDPAQLRAARKHGTDSHNDAEHLIGGEAGPSEHRPPERQLTDASVSDVRYEDDQRHRVPGQSDSVAQEVTTHPVGPRSRSQKGSGFGPDGTEDESWLTYVNDDGDRVFRCSWSGCDNETVIPKQPHRRVNRPHPSFRAFGHDANCRTQYAEEAHVPRSTIHGLCNVCEKAPHPVSGKIIERSRFKDRCDQRAGRGRPDKHLSYLPGSTEWVTSCPEGFSLKCCNTECGATRVLSGIPRLVRMPHLPKAYACTGDCEPKVLSQSRGRLQKEDIARWCDLPLHGFKNASVGEGHLVREATRMRPRSYQGRRLCLRALKKLVITAQSARTHWSMGSEASKR
jgi:hypothetical protein